MGRDESRNIPAIILVRPQMGENIGAAARVMRNFGFSELRIVAPRDGWPNQKAIDMAVDAADLIEQAAIYDTAEAALADLQYVAATTARMRDLAKPVLPPRDLAAKLRPLCAEGIRCGIMFGAERTGLTNEEIVLADDIVTIPVDPDYSSLNLAQSVAVICYEWMACHSSAGRDPVIDDFQPAPRADIMGFFAHLEAELDRAGFFKSMEMKPKMIANIRTMFLRAGLTEQEVRTLRGIVRDLAEGRRSPRKKQEA